MTSRVGRRRPPVETGWVLVGILDDAGCVARRVRRTAGSATCVRLDGAWILAREERRGDVVGFWHTHPPGVPVESATDSRTMAAFCLAFGKPLVSVVESDGLRVGWVHGPRAPRRPLARLRTGSGLVWAVW